MRKLGKNIIDYFIFNIVMWILAYTNCTSKAYEHLSRHPLEGSKQRWPGDLYAFKNPDFQSRFWELGGAYVYHGDQDLTRLLDVGACIPDSSLPSFVSPLDGADTLCQSHYFMKFVLFDLQLAELKAVDPIGGSFRAELQMVLHWMDSIINGSNGTEYTDTCNFVCDTHSPRPLCCDEVWVPPLRLSGCDIHEIESSTPAPKIFTSLQQYNLTYANCFTKEHSGECIWRRLWYLNIDATCESNMDFHNFPFDVQSLTIDIQNPYASRTWFQLTKGFLQDNIDEDFNQIHLSPDGNIPGWYVKDLKVSSSCPTSEAWKQTFLTQDILLSKLNNNSDAFGRYDTQYEDIVHALSPQKLTCSKMENFNNSKSKGSWYSINNREIYKIVKDNYAQKVNSTLRNYRQCIENNGRNFSWNMSVYYDKGFIRIPEFGNFNTSNENINRSFNILDLNKVQNMSKVWFPCAISALANLTTRGIQVTILVQRYREFYVVKLILPTVACVAFAFSAFGLQPEELVGRLTVVVPSAIALTALQSLVVSTDIPPLAYIAPSTYIFLFSYLFQILISFESVFVKWIASIGPHIEAPQMSATRKIDLFLMSILGALYIITIFVCTLLPLHRSAASFERETSTSYVSLWQGSTN